MFSRFRRSRRRLSISLPTFERMEPRQLLSGCSIDPTLRSDAQPDVIGTDGDDHIVISAGSNRGDLIINCGPDQAPTVVHNVANIVIDSGDGNDHIEFLSAGVASTVADGSINVTLGGGDGNDQIDLTGGGAALSVLMRGGAGDDVLAVTAGCLSWNKSDLDPGGRVRVPRAR